MGQRPADAIERRTVAVVAGDEADYDLGVLADRNLAEGQGSNVAPQAERSTNGASGLRLSQLRTKVACLGGRGYDLDDFSPPARSIDPQATL